ncbi:hypothetical protein LY78DRAFT_657053 [Colletotrichum sublineola]|nr:hypothetical protein LY78DRAFT_657053 [Colletotrichum sublineola]
MSTCMYLFGLGLPHHPRVSCQVRIRFPLATAYPATRPASGKSSVAAPVEGKKWADKTTKNR